MFISTSTIIPWSKLNNTPISTIQFIFRLNSYITLFIAYPFAVALANSLKNQKLMSTTVISLLVLIISGSSVVRMYKEQDTPINVKHYTNKDVVNVGYSFMHYDYTNIKTKENFDLLRDRPYFKSRKRVSIKEEIDENKISFVVNNNSINTCDMITPILRFKGQVCYINGKKANTQNSKYGTVKINVPAGISKITVTYNYSLVDRLTQLLSILSCCLLLYRIISDKYQEKRRLLPLRPK